jgi:hypothetical protein
MDLSLNAFTRRQHVAYGNTLDVELSLAPARRPHADARLRADARGGHAGIRQELASRDVRPSGNPAAIGDKPPAFIRPSHRPFTLLSWPGAPDGSSVSLRPRPSGHQQTVRVPFGCPSVAILSANA